MATHYCINCWRCRRGCSLCNQCACSPEELEKARQEKFSTIKEEIWGECDAEVMGPVFSGKDVLDKPVTD